jgi:hypothetical protein
MGKKKQNKKKKNKGEEITQEVHKKTKNSEELKKNQNGEVKGRRYKGGKRCNF